MQRGAPFVVILGAEGDRTAYWPMRCLGSQGLAGRHAGTARRVPERSIAPGGRPMADMVHSSESILKCVPVYTLTSRSLPKNGTHPCSKAEQPVTNAGLQLQS